MKYLTDEAILKNIDELWDALVDAARKDIDDRGIQMLHDGYDFFIYACEHDDENEDCTVADKLKAKRTYVIVNFMAFLSVFAREFGNCPSNIVEMYNDYLEHFTEIL